MNLHSEAFNLPDYLARIHYDGELTPGVDTLTRLMRQHLCHIPFENLDVQAGKTISLDPDTIVNKLVKGRRGGYCYETNGLFALALNALGIPGQLLMARPMFYPVARPKTHLVLLVHIDGRQLLCDLGFGSYGINLPLDITQTNQPVQQGYDRFQLLEDNGNYILQAWTDNNWQSQFGFNLQPAEWIDFVPANWLNCTHPDSFFVQKLIILQHTPTGRDIVLRQNFIQISSGKMNKTLLTAEQLEHLITDHFGLPLPGQLTTGVPDNI